MRTGKLFGLILIILAAITTTLFTGCAFFSEGTVQPAAAVSGQSDAEPTAPPTETPASTPTITTIISPVTSPEPTPEPYSGPDLQERDRADDEFFSDAAFFGNSLVDGLSLHGGFDNSDFYAVTSASVVSVGMTKNSAMSDGRAATMMQALTEKQYSKIYILLGINEIGFETAHFIKLYGQMLDQISASEQDADIYIMSLTPVTEKKSQEGDLFSMERIGQYNDALRELAEQRECYYIDLCDALAGEDGYLPSSQSTDGIHLKTDKYTQWAEYLRTHYA